MNALAKECDAVSVHNPFAWHMMQKIVCRHLGIGLSSRRDVKRIHKTKTGKEVVQTLLECAHVNKKNVNVLGGLLMTVRKLLGDMDVLIAHELLEQGWQNFALGCLKLHKQHPQFRELTIATILQLVRSTPTLPLMHEHAISGAPKIASLIPSYIENTEVLMSLLTILRVFLFALNTYHLLNCKPLPTSTLDSLQLSSLAKSLVDLLDKSAPRIVTGKMLDSVSEILTWISYYKSNAILRLPSNTGVLLFVAFLSCQSPLVRCRGFTGLVNIHREYAQKARSFTPEVLFQLQQSLTAEYPPVDELLPSITHALPELDPKTPHMVFCLRHLTPFTRLRSDGAPFNAYEAALRFVEYELHGPQRDDEWLEYPVMRIFGVANPTSMIMDDMAYALMFHNKRYETHVDASVLGVGLRNSNN
ncbi:hypothetical protein SISSUDRAFT_205283 [Sistotremastrum suecicum HHB10207 ss-3]|uniref:Uncharacterized protein n=1 Tax=Sistotremastrum suecicum HHB10207 ss-3 TaxID=1314776 RepID=A0A166GM31_9AGAM|nr:hypothetical protein SISSUDRAFT_205283 [Sistotremastrum suecicum HHB10207 ss-3]